MATPAPNAEASTVVSKGTLAPSRPPISTAAIASLAILSGSWWAWGHRASTAF